MLNSMGIGIIPGKAIFVPIHHLLWVDVIFYGLNDHATKLTSRVLKMSRCDFCGVIIFSAKITSTQVEYMLNDCQQDCFVGIVPTSTQISIIGSTGPDIQLDIFLVGQKNTHGRNVFKFMKSDESVAGEDSKLEEMCSELAGTHFMIRKIKF